MQRQETYDYNNRLQPVRIQLGTASSNAANYCLVYNYYAGVANAAACTATPTQAATGNNGSVAGYLYQDNSNPGLSHTASFTYDNVQRLATAAATPFGAGTVSYSDTYNYDQYGNMSWLPGGSGPVLTYIGSSNHINQIGSLYAGYDSAGNMTGDGTHTYQYDGEGRLASIDGGSTVAQVYNALGQQVQVSWAGGTWDVLFDPNGRWEGRSTAGNWQVGGVFHLGRRQVGIYIDQFYGIHENALGTSDSTTNAAGSETGQSLFYPWGQTWSLGSAAWNFSAFEYGSPPPVLAPTLFRTYNPALGRWLSPDLLGGDVSNPQSLNRYAYVTNNPTSFTDPLGLQSSDDGGGVCYANKPCEITVEGYPPAIPLWFTTAAGWPCLYFGWNCSGTSTHSRSGGRKGGGATSSAANNGVSVQRTFQRTFQCSSSASGVMNALENNFASFANNPAQGNFSTFSIFSPGAASPLGQVGINVGVQAFGHTIGYSDVSVTVQSVTSSQLVFQSNPGHVLYPAAVSFSASDAGNASITFTTNVDAITNGLWGTAQFYLLGGRAGETSTWRNLLNNVASFCAQPSHP